MLNGVGGTTIAEAKERMSYTEALQWAEYRKKHGSLNTGRRLEWGFALIAMLINRATGGDKEMTDYMPHAEKMDEPTADIGQVFNMLRGLKK